MSTEPNKNSIAQVKKVDLDILPIRTIDFANKAEKAAHDKMVELVEKMLDGKKKLADARTDADIRFYERLCASLDTQIDDEVHRLYDITPDERKIIESE